MRPIYKDGVFKPGEPVDLPDKAVVDLEARVVEPETLQRCLGKEDAQNEIFEILSRRYDTGQTDAAERHNERQP